MQMQNQSQARNILLQVEIEDVAGGKGYTKSKYNGVFGWCNGSHILGKSHYRRLQTCDRDRTKFFCGECTSFLINHRNFLLWQEERKKVYEPRKIERKKREYKPRGEDRRRIRKNPALTVRGRLETKIVELLGQEPKVLNRDELMEKVNEISTSKGKINAVIAALKKDQKIRGKRLPHRGIFVYVLSENISLIKKELGLYYTENLLDFLSTEEGTTLQAITKEAKRSYQVISKWMIALVQRGHVEKKKQYIKERNKKGTVYVLKNVLKND